MKRGRDGRFHSGVDRLVGFRIHAMKLIRDTVNGSGMFVEISFSFPAWLCAEKVENEKAKREITGRQACEFAVELPKGYDWSIPMAWKQAAIKSGQAYAVEMMAIGELAKGEKEKNDEWQARLAVGAVDREPMELDADEAWAFIIREGKEAGVKLATATPGETAGSKAKARIQSLQAKLAEMEAKLAEFQKAGIV